MIAGTPAARNLDYAWAVALRPLYVRMGMA